MKSNIEIMEILDSRMKYERGTYNTYRKKSKTNKDLEPFVSETLTKYFALLDLKNEIEAEEGVLFTGGIVFDRKGMITIKEEEK